MGPRRDVRRGVFSVGVVSPARADTMKALRSELQPSRFWCWIRARVPTCTRPEPGPREVRSASLPAGSPHSSHRMCRVWSGSGTADGCRSGSVSAGAAVTPAGLPGRQSQVGLAAWADLIADRVADGQSEVLELADVDLEPGGVSSGLGGQIGCADLRPGDDLRQGPHRPRPVATGPVEAFEPGIEIGDVSIGQRVVVAQRDPGILARPRQDDPVGGPRRFPGEPLPHRRRVAMTGPNCIGV